MCAHRAESRKQAVVERRPLALVLSLAALSTWCGWVSGFPQSSTRAVVSWVVSLALVLTASGFIWARRPGQSREGPERAVAAQPRRVRHYGLWLFLIAVVAAWEALGIDTGKHTPHLTISALSRTYRALDAATLLVWILAGIGYLFVLVRLPSSPNKTGRLPRPSGASDTMPVALLALPGGRLLGLLLPASRSAGVWFWISWLIACFLAEGVARLDRGHFATAAESLQVIARPVPMRILLAGGWVYAGWHLFVH